MSPRSTCPAYTVANFVIISVSLSLWTCREPPSRGREDAFLGCDGLRGWRGRRHGRGEGAVALQDGHHAVGEQPHVELGLVVRHATEAELRHQVVRARETPELRDLLETV